MTEEEAITKWCPMVRHTVYPNTVDPSGGNMPHDSSCCITSDCMMWRWEKADLGIKHGYCGLAGKP